MEEIVTLAVVILAAGQGTRMKSELPKVLHPLAGRAMVEYGLEVARQLANDLPTLVIGHGGDAVREALGDGINFVVQAEQLGTGHAVAACREALQGKAAQVLVYYADMPLMREETLRELVDVQGEHDGPFSMLTVHAERPRGFGRIVRNGSGQVQAIVEETDASAKQLEISEVNPGVYCFDADWLWNHVDSIPRSAKGEYYLTDMVGMAVDEGQTVRTVLLDDPAEAIGINTRVHLAEAEAALRRRINEGWMLAGVTIIDPATTYIDAQATIGADTVIMPGTHVVGATNIGRGCTIGPNSILRDSTIGDGCEIEMSVVEQALLEDEIDVGPFAHLRKGAHLEKGVHIGNFGEVKNARLRRGVKMGHFSYIGDA